MENRYVITMDTRNRTMSKAKFQQGDNNSDVLEIHLVSDGVPVDITGQSVEFNFQKPDKTVITQDITTGVIILDAPKGVFMCVLSGNTVAVAGTVKCNITFKKGNAVLSMDAFEFTVASNFNVDGILSSNYIGIVDDIVQKYKEAILLGGSGSSLEIVAARKGEIDLVTKITLIDTALANLAATQESDYNTLFQFANEGKTAVASAITAKGVAASSSDTFATLAIKIGQIETNSVLTGTALTALVVAGYTFYSSDSKTKLTGSMVDRGAVTITPNGTNQTIAEGYHNGLGKVIAVDSSPLIITTNLIFEM